MRFQIHPSLRCPRCYLHKDQCICNQAPELSLNTRLHLVMHVSELFKSTATGIPLMMALKRSQLQLRGWRGDNPAYRLKALQRWLGNRFTGHDPGFPSDDGRIFLTLFPSLHALPLDQFLEKQSASDLSRLTLLVADGNWNQASRMVRRLDFMNCCQHVCLPEGAVKAPIRLRENSNVARLSTYQAVASAIRLTEGEKAYKTMQDFFLEYVARYRATRGKSNPDETEIL